MSECENCNLKTCGIVCQRHVGHTIYEMIKNIDTCKSSIGEYPTTYGKIDTEYRVCKQRKMVGESPCTILSKESMTIGIDKQFNCRDFNLSVALDDYSKYIGNNEKSDIIKKYFNEINSKKRLIMPFKEKTAFSVDFIIDNVPYRNKFNRLYSHDWYIDDSYDIHCAITLNTNIHKKLTFDIEEYNKTFSISAIDIDTSLNNLDIIQFSKVGLIKPIELIVNNIMYAIDNVYIYKYNMGSCYIIGYWDGLNIKYINSNEIIKTDKNINKYIKVIAWHRRIIAPYYLMKPITFNIDKGTVE